MGRQFELKIYWNKWFKKTVELREHNSTTQMHNWDDINWAFGGFSVTVPPETVSLFIEEDLKSIYHRNGITLKIFLFGHPATEESYLDMVEKSKIQNFYAQGGLAPRVYDVVFLSNGKDRYLTQVTDYVHGNFVFDDYDLETYTRNTERVVNYGKENGINCGDLAHSNFKQGFFVDFQKFYFNPKHDCHFIKNIKENLGFGDETPYQPVEELSIKGKRNNKQRFEIMRKYNEQDVKILPVDFTALDFGCNAGYFLRKAFDYGAGYGVGVDRPNVIKAAEKIAIRLGYFNADFFSEVPDREFDLVFYLSMDAHFPFSMIAPLVKKIMYVEGHAGEGHDEKKYREMLEHYFHKVELIGQVDDCPQGQPRLWFRAEK